MQSLSYAEMAQMPESLIEVKECCSNCGKALGKGSSFVRATIEQVTELGEELLMDCDKRHFCSDCLKSGIYVNLKKPNANE